jgi:hypothetical protein
MGKRPLELQFEGKETFGMSQNKMVFKHVLEDFEKTGRSWQEKAGRVVERCKVVETLQSSTHTEQRMRVGRIAVASGTD